MKIAFCGASGTGKTTLAKWLAEYLKVPFNPVGSRSVAAELGFTNPYDVDRACAQFYERAIQGGASVEEAAQSSLESECSDHPTMRTHFQHTLQRAKIAWEGEHKHFVTDRTTVDDFAYCALHNVRGVDNAFLERAEQWTRTYDLIFFTPILSFHNTAGDPNRVEDDSAYHEVFELFCDGVLVNWLGSDWNEVVHYIGNAGLDDRMEEVARAVRARDAFLNRHFRAPRHQADSENRG
jgi:nicotinamide riboside kinase